MPHQPAGERPIKNKFLSNGDLFGMEFRQGSVFLEVRGWDQIKYAPFDQIGSVSANSSTDPMRLEDPDGDDILFVEEETDQVMHAAIGSSPANIRRFTNYPESENRLRRIPNLGVPTPTDDYGYVDGEDSPFEDPTDAEELWIPPGEHLDFIFANPDSRQHEPILSILMRIYRIDALDPTVEEDARAIRKVIDPTNRFPTIQAGGPDNQVNYDLQDAWGVVPLSQRQLDKVKRGEVL